MSGYLSNLLTNTTSKYNTLRRQLLSEETDGDTEDDSHIARSMRAYYTEKGRAFPKWLPPDPNAPQAAPAPAVYASATSTYGQPAAGGRASGGSGLSDLWDSGPRQNLRPQEPMSLRRSGGGAAQPRRGMVDSFPAQPQYQEDNRRPLPSQRAGSYQSSTQNQSRFSGGDPTSPHSTGSGGTAQERLKARLWGGSRAGGSQSSSANTSPAPSPGLSSVGSRNPYEGAGSRNQYENASSRNPYENASSRNPYENASSRGGGYRDQRQQDRYGGGGNYGGRF